MKAVPPLCVRTLSSLRARPAGPASFFARSGALTFLIDGFGVREPRRAAIARARAAGYASIGASSPSSATASRSSCTSVLAHDPVKTGIAVGRELLGGLIDRGHDPARRRLAQKRGGLGAGSLGDAARRGPRGPRRRRRSRSRSSPRTGSDRGRRARRPPRPGRGARRRRQAAGTACCIRRRTGRRAPRSAGPRCRP